MKLTQFEISLEHKGLHYKPNRFTDQIEFAQTQSSPSIQSILLQREDKEIITLFFKSYSESIGDLLKNYFENYQEPKEKQNIYLFSREKDRPARSTQKIKNFAKYIQRGQIAFSIQRKVLKQRGEQENQIKLHINNTQTNQEISMQIVQNATIVQLYEEVAYELNVQSQSLELIFQQKNLGIQLQESPSPQLKEIDIVNNSHLIAVPFKHGSYLHPKTKICMADKTQKLICEISKNEKVLSYDHKNQIYTEGQVSLIVKVKVKRVIRVILEGIEIICTPNHKFLMQNGQWACYQQKRAPINYVLKVGDKVKLCAQKMLPITQIIPEQLKEAEQFYHIQTWNCHSFISNGLFTNDMQIKIKYGEKKIILNMDYRSTVQKLKENIEQKVGINTKEQKLVYLGRILENNNKTLFDYDYQKNKTWIQLFQTTKNVITVNHIKSGQTLDISLQNLSKVKDLMIAIRQLFGISQNHQFLVYNNQQIFPQQQLRQYHNFKQKDYTVYLVTKDQLEGRKSLKQILINVIIQQKVFQYIKFRYQTVKQVIASWIKDAHPSYCLRYQDYVLKPNENFMKLEQLKFEPRKQIRCTIIRSYEKKLFLDYYIRNSYQKLSLQPKLKSEYQEQKLTERLCKLRNQHPNIGDVFQQIRPISIYTGYYYLGLNALLRNISLSEEKQLQDDFDFSLCSNLVNSLKRRKNYVGQVHRGTKNFKISSYYKVKTLISFKSFTSTSKRLSIAKQKDFLDQGGTLFHINSLEGKDISPFSNSPDQEEVLFPPYTYFLFDRFQQKGKGKQYQEVWLSEMPSPRTFQKNIILWLDFGQTGRMGQVLDEVYKQKIEILQLTSRQMTLLWLKEFSWLDHLKIQVRILTQIEGIEQIHKVGDYPFLLFCRQNQLQKANKYFEGIKLSKNSRITTQRTDVKNYCNF